MDNAFSIVCDSLHLNILDSVSKEIFRTTEISSYGYRSPQDWECLKSDGALSYKLLKDSLKKIEPKEIVHYNHNTSYFFYKNKGDIKVEVVITFVKKGKRHTVVIAPPVFIRKNKWKFIKPRLAC